MGEETRLQKALRRLASGVYVVTTSWNEASYGLLATSVVVASLKPATLLVTVGHTASAHDALDSVGFFCINALADSDGEIAHRFGNSAERASRFADRTWRTLATGAPALVGSVASFDCKVAERFRGPSYSVFAGIVEVIELWTAEPKERPHAPLVYHDNTYIRL